MAEASFGSSSPVGSLSSEDHDFDPTAEMLVHEYDDERTLEEEELMEGERNFSAEIEDLQKEGTMPIEELLAIYRYEAAVSTVAGSSVGSSPGELTDELPDMTLDKEEIAKDLLSGDDEETQSSADDLTPSVTSHETTDFFPRTLRSNAIYDCDRESEGEDDGVNPSEDSRKEIMVGSQYQAEIPSHLCKYTDDEKAYEDDDQLLWSPNVLPENEVKDFLHEASLRVVDGKTQATAEGAQVRDNEQALYKLLKCNYNVHEALERYRRDGKSLKDEMLPWTEEECRNFEHALQIYDKNFHLVQKHKVTTRTVAECVAFYYVWKKSERFDYFVQQNRFGKKKYSSYPGVTDLMDRLVDEAEGLGVDGSPSVCSSSGRMEPIPDQQLSILNSITASDLTALTNTVATVCNSADVNCLESYTFSPLDSLHRGPLNHVPVVNEEPLNFTTNGDNDCLNLLDAGFYHSDLNQINMCSEDCERPAKRLKMGLSEPFINDVSVNNLGVDFENHTHHITSAKMAVSVADFGSLSSNESNGFMNSHTLHQHAALQSE
ncbi:mesoderm induction early response protein 3-like [Acipenser oxyrinchus oxyrinchus]|uniref:Mesoderm induction early response protein 3-like n=1 Tax=Acipenser oxyrinchus oxyrinchus TaxID=40147 RepID=A0AAD8GKL7_ACIOX|nr:mesoderm induction early response protein 3-like [Acipenser oxyrinchus oxyrinchus]KAK1176415.1 mesoderm induction early response protein 3-like [Acipenser oxyrinchus oxyrinchus]